MLKTTPMLLARSYDEGLFMAIAAADILGAILAFGGIIVMLAIFNANIFIKIIDFILLIGVMLITARLAMFSLRPRYATRINKVSQIAAGIYCICLVVAAVYCMVQLFIS
ncbi:hypothetical protein [Dictyobacter halimunensis]